MKKLNMFRVNRKCSFKGFTLKPGFYVGRYLPENRYIASSGWECEGNMYVYFLEENGSWEGAWVDMDDINLNRVDINPLEELYKEFLSECAWISRGCEMDGFTPYGMIFKERIKTSKENPYYAELFKDKNSPYYKALLKRGIK